MKYCANDTLEVMKNAKNYNNFLAGEIIKLIKQFNFKNILDFGCADGHFINKIKKKVDGNFIGIEIDSDSIEKCKEQNINVFDDILKVNSNIKLDLIYSLNVLEHIEDDIELLNKLKEKLSYNGKILLYVPAIKFLFSSMDKKAGHYRRYTKKELVEKLISCGFKIEKICYCDSLGVFATFAFKIKDFFKNSNGNLKIKYVKFYDSIFFISRFFDKLLFSKFFGKNLLAIISIN